jgi:NADPH:quinone reductase
MLMKHIRVHEYGDPQVMRLEETAMPTPGPQEVRVRIEAAGLNYIDTYQRSGQYKVPLPFTPGMEAAGVVDAIGAEVTLFQVGDAVAYGFTAGAYAEYALVPADKLVPIPDGVSSEVAAAVMLQGMTAHYLSHATYPIQAGDTVVIHAAAGATGQLLVQMAKLRGARIIATASTPERTEIARQLGADAVCVYADVVQVARAFTQGEGVHCVYDSVGVDTFMQSLDCLRPRGMMVLYGQASGAVPPLDLQVLNAKGSLFVTRPSLGHYLRTREELLSRAGDCFTWIRQSKLQVTLDRRFPLAEAPAAHHALTSRATQGKVLLIP